MIINASCFNNNSFALTVVGGTTQPSNPTKNTLWVNTDVDFSTWSFAPSAPDYLSSTGVWIQTGFSSNMPFNILSSNDKCVYVYPIGVKQWDNANNCFVDLTSVSQFWDGSQWIDFVRYLYNAGDECNAITGGWQAYSTPVIESDVTGAAPNLTKNTDSMYMVGNIYSSGVIRTVNKVSFSNITKIILDATTSPINSSDGSLYNYMQFYLWSDLGSTWDENMVYNQWIGSTEMNGEYTFDVSSVSNGEYYIGFAFYSTDASGSTPAITLRSMKLE